MPRRRITTTSTPSQSYGYVRCSTAVQADKGFTLEAQTERIRAMAVVHGVELADIIVDAGESAKSLDRAGMTHLLGLVNRGLVNKIIVAKLDRVTRSVKDLASLLELFEKRSVSLVSVAESLDTQSAAGRLVLNIMVSVGQWEREAIGERTRTVLQHKKSIRKVYSSTPFGFDAVDGKLVPSPVERAVIERVKELRLAGLPLAKIAAKLNASGTPTKRPGGTWFASTVDNILENTLHG